MKIGYYVQGAADDAFVHGLAKRWCPNVEFAPGRRRGESDSSFRRDIAKALLDLRDNHRCDVLVILTDSDDQRWRELKQREWSRVPLDCQHMSVFGVAERNIECWLSADRTALAKELKCEPEQIPTDDPSGFVKRRFGLGERDVAKEDAKKQIQAFVAAAPLKAWIENSESFRDFYDDARRLAAQRTCQMPNERDT
jgi:broad specificity phosphatase PhoE